MKYKSKFSADQKHFHTSYTMKIDEGQVLNDVEGLIPGVLVFIPLTDERFFEPVKTHKFEVEVSEEDMERFMFYNTSEPWKHKEITENKYLEALKANRNVHIDVVQILSDTTNLNYVTNAYLQMIEEFAPDQKFEVIKAMKYWLVDHYPSISGLKEAKDIVDSWWSL